MKITGKTKKVDIGAGVLVLEADDGKTYQLNGSSPKLKKPDQRIEADGNIDESTMSTGMLGPIFNVLSFKVL